MEGFELLIIAIFILFSILEGVLGKKKRESRKEKDAPEAPDDEGAEPWWAEPGGPEGEGPASSDVLVPEEIWEEITGERRKSGRESRPEPAGVDAEADDAGAREEGRDDRTPAERLESLRYEGSGERRPEAEIEAADASGEAISLERLEIDGEARHRRFHQRYLPSVRAGGTAYGTSGGAGASRLRKELDLRGSRALRRAVLYREILGPPKAIREDEIGGR